MILTVTNFCENIGKSTVVIYLAKYLIKNRNFDKIHIIDNGKDFTLLKLFQAEEIHKFESKILLDSVSNEKINILNESIILSKIRDLNELYIIDLKADFDSSMINLLKFSNYIICPFAYYNNVLNSSIEFGKFLHQFYEGDIYFLNNFFDKKNTYDLSLIDNLSKYGNIIGAPVFFTNNLNRSFQSVFNDELVFRKAFDELSFTLFD